MDAVDWPAQPDVVQAANTLIAYEAFQQLQHIWRDHPEQLGQGLRLKLAGAAQLGLNEVHAARVQADVWQQQVSALLAEQVDVLMWPGREALPETLQDLIIGALDDAAENMRDTVKTILGPLAAAGGRPLPES